jgi:hypothetical protein
MKIRPVRAELFHADGQTDMKNLTAAFRNFANAPKNPLCFDRELLESPCTTTDGRGISGEIKSYVPFVMASIQISIARTPEHIPVLFNIHRQNHLYRCSTTPATANKVSHSEPTNYEISPPLSSWKRGRVPNRCGTV